MRLGNFVVIVGYEAKCAPLPSDNTTAARASSNLCHRWAAMICLEEEGDRGIKFLCQLGLGLLMRGRSVAGL